MAAHYVLCTPALNYVYLHILDTQRCSQWCPLRGTHLEGVHCSYCGRIDYKFCGSLHGSHIEILIQIKFVVFEEPSITHLSEHHHVNTMCIVNCSLISLVPRPHPDFYLAVSPRLRDKIWVGPGDEATP